ncbi:hypothetical protein MF672_006545 [Actinomadura sp. ATCC 31491]|uniref:DUF3558 domain-containing protein n=1 Tax=Actinomadura luzonensis TaxID=2805427 RepID=A0ABT0FMC2_9ACTN|nr:hypothetical protein [Actinomadura luzonensis]MCK2213452.1 hypothetical protein [Actinomadura luzonensis]
MRASILAPLLLMAMAMASACTSSPPPDTRPLGNVTASPQECGLIAKRVIIRATGVEMYEASGSERGGPFSYCVVTDPQHDDRGSLLSIQLDNPSALSAEELANTKKHDHGVDLPPGLGPGYTANFDGKNSRNTYAYAWTSDASRLLSVWITPGASGRDHRADAIEFIRQLRPVLLATAK